MFRTSGPFSLGMKRKTSQAQHLTQYEARNQSADNKETAACFAPGHAGPENRPPTPQKCTDSGLKGLVTLLR